MQVSPKDKVEQEILALLQSEATYQRGFAQMMTSYQEKLYWHVRRMVTEHEDANDVIQNTFVKVHKSILKFEGKSKLFTWLYRIATNEALTFLKKRNRNRNSSLDDEDNLLSEQLEADPYFDGDEAQLKLKQALATLPEKQKLVFNLRYYDEMTYKDMAEVLETSEGALKASYHHAVKKVELFFRGNEKI